ncbi:hypothetical protein EV122DRAFT_273979 [Schizophyllum commune]
MRLTRLATSADAHNARERAVVGDRALAFASSLVTTARTLAVTRTHARLCCLVTYLDVAHYKLLPLPLHSLS